MTGRRRIVFAVLVSASAMGCRDSAPREQRAEGEGSAYVESEAARAAAQLTMDRPDEAVALLEKHLVSNPKDASAHFELARALRQQAFELKLKNLTTDVDVAVTRTKILTKAAEEYRRCFALLPDLKHPDTRVAGLMGLVEIYGRNGLGRPADAEQVARRLVDEDPQNADSYKSLGQALGEQGRHDEAADVLRKARSTLPASQQRNLGIAMWSYVKLTRNVPSNTIEALVDEMTVIADSWLANHPGDATGPIVKEQALKLQVEYLESDPERKRQVLAEARQWQQVAEKHLRGETADVIKLVDELKKRQQKVTNGR